MYYDEQLVVDYLKGDEKSLEILIHRYLKPIYNFVYRYVGDKEQADDITQIVFVKAWKNLKKFHFRSNGSAFKIWIFQIAKNTALDFLRKKKTIPFSEFENTQGENIIMETLRDPLPLAPEILEKADIAKSLNGAMEKLSLTYRMVLFLHYNDHFTFREIAEILGEPLNTVKSQHRRALLILKKLLTDAPNKCPS